MAREVKGPTFDYFRGVSVGFEHGYANFLFSDKLGFSIPADRIKSVGPNNLGGISVTFGSLVTYNGISEGSLRLTNHDVPLGIEEKYVGRITVGKEKSVVWQHSDVA